MQGAPQFQIFQDREIGEQLPRFRDLDEAESHNPLGRQVLDGGAEKNHFSLGSPVQSADDLEQRAFPRPVGANEGNDFSLRYMKGHPPEHLNPAIMGGDIDHLEHCPSF